MQFVPLQPLTKINKFLFVISFKMETVLKDCLKHHRTPGGEVLDSKDVCKIFCGPFQLFLAFVMDVQKFVFQ